MQTQDSSTLNKGGVRQGVVGEEETTNIEVQPPALRDCWTQLKAHGEMPGIEVGTGEPVGVGVLEDCAPTPTATATVKRTSLTVPNILN